MLQTQLQQYSSQVISKLLLLMRENLTMKWPSQRFKTHKMHVHMHCLCLHSKEFEGGVRNLTEILNNEKFQALYRNVGMVNAWNERDKTGECIGDGVAMLTLFSLQRVLIPLTWCPVIVHQRQETRKSLPPSYPLLIHPHTLHLQSDLTIILHHQRWIFTQKLHAHGTVVKFVDRTQNEELNRREALEKKLEEERVKGKKKKKRLM